MGLNWASWIKIGVGMVLVTLFSTCPAWSTEEEKKMEPTIRVRLVSQPWGGVTWKIKSDTNDSVGKARPSRGDQRSGSANPNCERESVERVEVWTLKGDDPIVFVFEDLRGEFPITTEFSINPGKREILLDSNGSIGYMWDTKLIQGVSFMQSDITPPRPEGFVGGSMKTLRTWSDYFTMQPPKAIFYFNWRGTELTNVEILF